MDASELRAQAVHVRGALSRGAALAILAGVFASACSTLPAVKMARYAWPKDAYIGEPGRPYDKLGLVRAKLNYASLDPNHEEKALCKNYFNKAAAELVVRARKVGADAVIDVRSAVFLFDGRAETYPSPECSDDGQEGQVLAQGIAVKWRKPGDPVAAPAPKAAPGGDEHPAIEEGL